MDNRLSSILNKINNENENQQELGYAALSVIKEILSDNPYDLDARITRIQLNSGIFENSSAIIEDATFISENEQFGKNRMVGYDWLFSVYEETLSMPDKAREVLEEQLVDMQNLFPFQHEKNELEGTLLNKLAQLEFDNGDKDMAVVLWQKSFDKYPFLNYRNGYVGMYLLETNRLTESEDFLLLHYDWCYNTEDGYRLQYGIKLKELYDAGKLEDHGDLVGLMFHVMRNETEHFKIEGKLDFFEQYYSELERFANRFTDSALLWAAIANMYLLDIKNYNKSFEAFQKLATTKDSFRFIGMDRAIKAAKKSDNDFFKLEFSFNLWGNNLYSCLTDLSSAYDKVKSKKKKKKFAQLAIAYGKMGYDRFRKYIIDGTGSTHDNHPHVFAMLCNNYANALGEYADSHHEEGDEEYCKLYQQAGDIHIEGYKVSPFRENISNAAKDYYRGKDYSNTIKYTKESIAEYHSDFSVADLQAHYHRIIKSSIYLKDIKTADEYYFKSKELFLKVGKGSKDANFKFIFCGKLLYQYAVIDQKNYEQYIAEMEWYLKNEVATKQEPLEHGLVSYFLGLCYSETGQNDKALSTLQVAVDYLQDADWEFYDDKCEKAETLIEALGGEVIKRKSDDEKPGWRHTIDLIILPFKILGLILGLIWDLATGKFPGKKHKEGDD